MYLFFVRALWHTTWKEDNLQGIDSVAQVLTRCIVVRGRESNHAEKASITGCRATKMSLRGYPVEAGCSPSRRSSYILNRSACARQFVLKMVL